MLTHAGCSSSPRAGLVWNRRLTCSGYVAQPPSAGGASAGPRWGSAGRPFRTARRAREGARAPAGAGERGKEARQGRPTLGGTHMATLAARLGLPAGTCRTGHRPQRPGPLTANWEPALGRCGTNPSCPKLRGANALLYGRIILVRAVRRYEGFPSRQRAEWHAFFPVSGAQDLTQPPQQRLSAQASSGPCCRLRCLATMPCGGPE